MSNNYLFPLFGEVDSYKIGMHAALPKGLTEVYSFLESRGGPFDEIVAFGQKFFVDRYLSKPLTSEDVDDLVTFFKLRPEPFNEAGLRAIVAKHGGWLPLEVKAVPEGTIVPTGVPYVTVRSTDPEAAWLTTITETSLLSFVWFCSSVATLSREIKKRLIKWNAITSPDFTGVDFQLHNFGDRGAAPGSAGWAGASHLVMFSGTDSLAGTATILKHYNEKDRVFGYSVPAMEHSISTAWGPDREKEYVLAAIQAYREKFDIISIVGDTYDIFSFVKMICTDPDIRAAVESLASEGKKIVIRPDSGEPREVLCGILDIIEEHYPCTRNSAGYKVLYPGIGILWGDGITLDSIEGILKAVAGHGWATQNIVFGMGGQLVQTGMIARDTLKYAMKASNIIEDGVSKGIAKDPITARWKASKKGKFSVIYGADGRVTWLPGEDPRDIMETIYLNGVTTPFGSFQDVKDRAEVV